MKVFVKKAAAFVLTAFVLSVAAFGVEAKACRLVFSGYEGKEALKDFPALVKIPDGLAVIAVAFVSSGTRTHTYESPSGFHVSISCASGLPSAPKNARSLPSTVESA